MIAMHEVEQLQKNGVAINKGEVIEISTGKSDEAIYYLTHVINTNGQRLDVLIHHGSLLFDKIFMFKNISCLIRSANGRNYSANIFLPMLDTKPQRLQKISIEHKNNNLTLFCVEIFRELLLEE